MESNTSGNITFNVTLEEANKIFKALGNLPFVEVYELIGKLNEQANHQLSSRPSAGSFPRSGTALDIDQLFSDSN
ncbi:MAG TPA: hypothetical protein VIK89_12810 [Cytophagaceae bacterium]